MKKCPVCNGELTEKNRHWAWLDKNKYGRKEDYICSKCLDARGLGVLSGDYTKGY